MFHVSLQPGLLRIDVCVCVCCMVIACMHFGTHTQMHAHMQPYIHITTRVCFLYVADFFFELYSKNNNTKHNVMGQTHLNIFVGNAHIT